MVGGTLGRRAQAGASCATDGGSRPVSAWGFAKITIFGNAACMVVPENELTFLVPVQVLLASHGLLLSQTDVESRNIRHNEYGYA